MIQVWLKEDVTTYALVVALCYQRFLQSASCSKARNKNGEFISLELIHVFTPSSLRWALWMCRGSRTGTAISVQGCRALMMMAVDLLCSAFWAPELLALVRWEAVHQHALLQIVVSLYAKTEWLRTTWPLCTEVHTAVIKPVNFFCFSLSYECFYPKLHSVPQPNQVVLLHKPNCNHT